MAKKESEILWAAMNKASREYNRNPNPRNLAKMQKAERAYKTQLAKETEQPKDRP